VIQAAFTDEATAYDEATGLVLSVASKWNWTDEEINAILDDVDAAHAAAGAWGWDELLAFTSLGASSYLWGMDVGAEVDVFWETLRGLAAGWTVAGADDLRATFSTAVATVEDEEEEEEANQLTTQLAGAAAQSAEDVEDAGAAAVATTQQPWFWPVVGIAATLAIALLVRVR
jgi:hypothetical protein